jgi:hypothetical protein
MLVRNDLVSSPPERAGSGTRNDVGRHTRSNSRALSIAEALPRRLPRAVRRYVLRLSLPEKGEPHGPDAGAAASYQVGSRTRRSSRTPSKLIDASLICPQPSVRSAFSPLPGSDAFPELR